MKNQYRNNRSAQVARHIRRNRERNLPRLERLKECIGCMKCGKTNVPGRYLDGHHVNDRRKYRPLAHLANRRWLRVVREIFGIERDEPNGGGPIEFVCQRYHEERHRLGGDAKTCVELEAEGFEEPWRVHGRITRRRNDRSVPAAEGSPPKGGVHD